MLRALLGCGHSVSIDLVFWDRRSANSGLFTLDDLGNVRIHPRSQLDEDGLLRLLSTCQPDIVYVSGWMDKGYLSALRRYRSRAKSVLVVCGIDDQWHGTPRQQLGRCFYRLRYASLFDFMWVAGKPQYHYAQRLGYSDERIIGNLLSADTDLVVSKAPTCRRFVFVGRFDPVKALDKLLAAYTQLPATVQQEWPLVLIGDGQLRAALETSAPSHVQVLPFLQPRQLVTELMKGGVGCIASDHEQWGVAVHEMALLGFPLVLSSSIGAATEFLVSGYNGFLFKSGSTESLHRALLKVTELTDSELADYSARSRDLGKRIDSQLVAHSLLSVLELVDL